VLNRSVCEPQWQQNFLHQFRMTQRHTQPPIHFWHTILGFIVIVDLTTGWIKSIHRFIRGKVRYCSLHHTDKTSSGALAVSQSYLKMLGRLTIFIQMVLWYIIQQHPIIQQSDVCVCVFMCICIYIYSTYPQGPYCIPQFPVVVC
jgi:hypothetical protein